MAGLYNFKLLRRHIAHWCLLIKIYFFSSAHAYTVICPTVIRLMKHKHVYNNWTRKVQNMASNLNVSRSVAFKSQWLEVCEIVSVLHIVLEPYQFHTFQSCHVKSCKELYRILSTFVKVSWQDSPPFLKKGKTLLQTFWGVEGYFHSLHSTRWWPACCQLGSLSPSSGRKKRGCQNYLWRYDRSPDKLYQAIVLQSCRHKCWLESQPGHLLFQLRVFMALLCSSVHVPGYYFQIRSWSLLSTPFPSNY